MPNFSDIILDENTPAPAPSTPLNHESDETHIDENKPNPNPNPNTPPPDDPPADEPIMIGETEVTEGMELETPDGVLKFTNGTLVNDKGEVIKNADEVRDYLAQFNDEPSINEFNLAAVQSLFDVTVNGDDGKPVEFTDDETGRAAYVAKVIELKQKEASDIALNTFFANNPTVKQFNDFITAGGDPRNFGKIPDRTGIQFEADNTNQHKAIIRTAWAENGNRGDVEKYIKYLEDSGALADTAFEELKNIQQRDADYKADIAKRAEAARTAEIEELNKYWNTIHNTIKNGVIGGYKIPESIVREVNGQKVALNRDDFFNYISRRDENNTTQYQRDLESLSEEDSINRELLDAYLHFSGGTYEDLIKLAVKEAEVTRLKLTAKQHKSSGTVKITKPSNGKAGIKDIIL